MRFTNIGSFALLALLSYACSSTGNAGDALNDGTAATGGQAATNHQGGAGGTSSASMGGSSGSPLSILGGGGTTGDGTGATDCSTTVGAVIYVVSEENVLQAFDPQASTFTTIGKLACPAGLATPFSMAVDRSGVAFVLYNNGKIFLVSTVDASCQASTFQPNQAGFSTFGMGYVSDAAGSDSETLFIMDDGTKGLGSISDQGIVSAVANFDTLHGSAEVTGTGDGRLFGFFVDISDSSKTSVAEIDKTSAHVISNAPQTLPSIDAWAFAFWGGSFYLFNASGGGHSRVDKYTPGMGTTNVVMDAGFTIVGAGVSTCAPVVAPPIH